MSFGTNLQFFRKLCNKMTQEDLAEKLQVSRQTISKWELDTAFPSMDKAVELCQLFSCTLDNLFRDDMSLNEDAYSDIRVETVEGFRYIPYAVISMMPEDDAMDRIRQWAKNCGAEDPQIIGWDFPVVSQEQINVYHMHGYTAAWVLPPDMTLEDKNAQIMSQPTQRYAAITIKNPFQAPFRIIPHAYKTLSTYMQINGLTHKEDPEIISCFERTHVIDGVTYMDVFIAAM